MPKWQTALSLSVTRFYFSALFWVTEEKNTIFFPLKTWENQRFLKKDKNFSDFGILFAPILGSV